MLPAVSGLFLVKSLEMFLILTSAKTVAYVTETVREGAGLWMGARLFALPWLLPLSWGLLGLSKPVGLGKQRAVLTTEPGVEPRAVWIPHPGLPSNILWIQG